jgi:hypothetical protein
VPATFFAHAPASAQVRNSHGGMRLFGKIKNAEADCLLGGVSARGGNHPRWIWGTVMEFWIEKFEKIEWLNHHVEVTIVTRANQHLVLQMTWEAFDAACDMFKRLPPA